MTDSVLTWYDVFPVQEQLVDMTPDQVFWVDVGAGRGHRTREFCTRFPICLGNCMFKMFPAL